MAVFAAPVVGWAPTSMHRWRRSVARTVKAMPLSAEPLAFLAADSSLVYCDPAHEYHQQAARMWAEMLWNGRFDEAELLE
eukprot:4366206-Amphidinium_carterae.2